MKISICSVPRFNDRALMYYHGTSTDKNIQRIMTDGLDPQATEIKYGAKRPVMRPVEGQVYITPYLRYALIYALGGDVAGHEMPSTLLKDRYGTIFVFGGDTLVDIGPDEDGVGLIAHLVLSEAKMDTLKYYADTYAIDRMVKGEIPKYLKATIGLLTPKQYADIKGFKGGEAVTQTLIGKKLVKHMPDHVKLEFIDAGCHIAHKGLLKPIAAYLIDKTLCKELKRDGSNFFEYAVEYKQV